MLKTNVTNTSEVVSCLDEDSITQPILQSLHKQQEIFQYSHMYTWLAFDSQSACAGIHTKYPLTKHEGPHGKIQIQIQKFYLSSITTNEHTR